MNIIIFGAGGQCRRYLAEIDAHETILAITDNNNALHGQNIGGHLIIPPQEIMDYPFEKIVIAIDDYSISGYSVCGDIINQLEHMGIEQKQISLVSLISKNDGRVEFTRSFAVENPAIEGAVAECGVNRGYYAYYLNRFFPKPLYLFDSFEGFNTESFDFEENQKTKIWMSNSEKRYSVDATERILMRMESPEYCHVLKGFVPHTLTAVENEKFCFVCLDMDVYKPTIDALRFFAPRMVRGGIILLHDYVAPVSFPGIKRAVDEFAGERKILRIPVQDNYSIALIVMNE